MKQHVPVHKNLVQYYASATVEENGVIRGVILTEYCQGGLLAGVVLQCYPQGFSERTILGIMRDIACGLFALHTNKPCFSHRNIHVVLFLLVYSKPDFIQIDQNGRCKLEVSRSMTSNIIVCIIA